MDKQWHVHSLDSYSELKRNELPSPEKTWKSLKCVLQSERGQSVKAVYCGISPPRYTGKSRTVDTVKRSVVARDGREGCTGGPRGFLGSEPTLHVAMMVDTQSHAGDSALHVAVMGDTQSHAGYSAHSCDGGHAVTRSGEPTLHMAVMVDTQLHAAVNHLCMQP